MSRDREELEFILSHEVVFEPMKCKRCQKLAPLHCELETCLECTTKDRFYICQNCEQVKVLNENNECEECYKKSWEETKAEAKEELENLEPEPYVRDYDAEAKDRRLQDDIESGRFNSDK